MGRKIDPDIARKLKAHDDYQNSITVATVTIHSPFRKQASNSDRLILLSNIIQQVGVLADIVVLPAGFYKVKRKPKKIYSRVEKDIAAYLNKEGIDTTICLGIDGRYDKDQIGLAINKSGIISIARKFYPTIDERNDITIADDFNCLEDGKSRVFKVKEKKFYLAICYDAFGIIKSNLVNPYVNGIINLAHGFYPLGCAGSGEVYFAKYGFAGSSRQWECPVFGSATFFQRKIPTNWPTGVLWNQGSKSIQNWKYKDNALAQFKEIDVPLGNENVLIKLHKI